MSGEQLAVEAVIARVKAVYRGWRRDTTPAQMRADWDALFSARGNASVADVSANGVPCQWLDAPGVRQDRVVVYFHGGGFQVGSLASHNELMAQVSAASGARVLGVDYRLAPEHPYPAAHEDARRVFDWLLAQGLPAHRLALAGDSAGGNLALSLLLWLHEQGRPLPAAFWGMSPWTDLSASGASYQTHAALDPIHQRPMIVSMARSYLGAAGRAADPLVSPLLADATQLAALPPMLLQVGGRETLVSDAQDLAARAGAAGARAELQIWPGMIHVFQQFPAELPEAREALAAGGRFVAACLDAAFDAKTRP